MLDDQAPVAGDSGSDEAAAAPSPAEDEGLLDTLADGAGEVAKKTGSVLWTMIVKVVKEFYRYIIVIFLPIPVSYLAKKTTRVSRLPRRGRHRAARVLFSA